MNAVRPFRIFLALLGALVLPAGAFGQSPEPAKSPSKSPAVPTLSDRFEGLEFRLIGPYRGGRVTAVTGVRGQPQTFYFGGTGGGVWKTTDGGSNWEAVSDKDFKTGSIGAIAVSESDPNVVYVGMGEAPIRGNVSHGDGVYKSTDAGQHLEEHRPARHAADRARARPSARTPTSSTSRRWATSGDRTPSAASSARRTAARPGRRSSSSTTRRARRISRWIPNNPRILYAAFWQVVRHPWELDPGGPGSSACGSRPTAATPGRS